MTRMSPTLRPPLREIAIELTSKCNLSCAMCSVWKGMRDGLPGDRVLALLEEARGLGADTFTPFGAEIFMRKDTPAILEAAGRMGYASMPVVTNGMLVARHIGRLAAIPALRLHVSIDGPEHVHDALRGRGSYRSAVDGIRAARAAGLRPGLKTVLMRPTLATLGDMVDLAVDLDLAELSIQPFQPEIAGPDEDHSPWVFPRDATASVAAVLDRVLEKARLAGIAVTTESLFPEFLPYLFDGHRPVPRGGCHMPARFLMVDAWGETYPCFFMRERSMGNVTEGLRLADIWTGPAQAAMVRRGRTGHCPGCLASCSDVESFDAMAHTV